MGTPHKHAELIKAWADGARIQYKCNTLGGFHWEVILKPHWEENVEYRIKPDTLKYRVALFYDPNFGSSWTDITISEQIDFSREKCFVRWLTDWVEVEI